MFCLLHEGTKYSLGIPSPVYDKDPRGHYVSNVLIAFPVFITFGEIKLDLTNLAASNAEYHNVFIDVGFLFLLHSMFNITMYSQFSLLIAAFNVE